MHSSGSSILFAALATALSARSSSGFSPGFQMPIQRSHPETCFAVISKNLCFHEKRNSGWLVLKAEHLRHHLSSISGATNLEVSNSEKQQDEVQSNFRQWIKQNGIQSDLLQISIFDGLRGLAATEELFPGQVVKTSTMVAQDPMQSTALPPSEAWQLRMKCCCGRLC